MLQLAPWARIGIVRLSGRMLLYAAKFLSCKTWGLYPKNRYLYYGYLKNKAGETLDEVLVSFMKGPHTFTREDVVEINGHGGAMSLRMILKEVLLAGARAAEPGEFTKRAFLNGRIDLSQAESMLMLIRARSEKAVKIATANMKGILSNQIDVLKKQALGILAHLEAEFDFPEETLQGAEQPAQFDELNRLEVGLARGC